MDGVLASDGFIICWFTIRYLYEYRKYLLDIYYIQNISMCRNTEKKCMHYENGIKDEKNI